MEKIGYRVDIFKIVPAKGILSKFGIVSSERISVHGGAMTKSDAQKKAEELRQNALSVDGDKLKFRVVRDVPRELLPPNIHLP